MTDGALHRVAEPSPAEERRRLASGRRHHIPHSGHDGASDTVTPPAARVLDAPMTAVTPVDVDRVWLEAARTGRCHPNPRTPGPCAPALPHDAPRVVPDALTTPSAQENR